MTNKTLSFSLDNFSVDAESRTITGVALPFGVRAKQGSRFFAFAKGLLSGVDTSQTRLRYEHDEKTPAVGRLKTVEETDEGVVASFSVYKTALGNDVLELANNEELSLSATIEIAEQLADGTITRIKSMPEVSVTQRPVFRNAVITAVAFSEEESNDTVRSMDNETVDLTPITAEISELRNDVVMLSNRLDAGGPAPTGNAPSVEDYLAQLILPERRASFAKALAKSGDFVSFALDDITTDAHAGENTDLAGLLAPRFYADRVQQVLDWRRPLFASFGAWEYSPTGYTIPYVGAVEGLVGDRGEQKSEIDSAGIVATQRNFSNIVGAGGVDVAIEAIQASPQTLNIVLRTLRHALARYTEGKAVAKFNAPIANEGSMDGELPTDTWKNFAMAVSHANRKVRAATGVDAEYLAVPEETYTELLGLTDMMDRRVLSTVNPQNADAQASLTSQGFSIPGTRITVFEVPGLNRAAAYNREAIVAPQSPVFEANAVTVAKMGVDYGIMQSFALIDLIPSGIVFFGETSETSE